MNKALNYLIEQVSKEKHIPKEELLNLLEESLLSAIKKTFNNNTIINLKIDPKTGEIKVFETKKIVDMVTDNNTEISIIDIKNNYPDKNIGDTVDILIPFQDFGRIAIQTAKQVLSQKVKEAEKDIIFEEYRHKIGSIISGAVIGKDKNNYIIAIGKTEAILPEKEALPNEPLKKNDLIRAYILNVKQSNQYPLIILSRTTPNFILELFKIEVPEIRDNIVIIKNIAREAGERTKISVFSQDLTIDPVGACVGIKGTRVQSIVRELKGERIDIIQWHDDPRIFIARALTPASIEKVGINENDKVKTAMVIADDNQLSLAIGKRGTNIKLATKLTGWEIDILNETDYAKLRQNKTESLPELGN